MQRVEGVQVDDRRDLAPVIGQRVDLGLERIVERVAVEEDKTPVGQFDQRAMRAQLEHAAELQGTADMMETVAEIGEGSGLYFCYLCHASQAIKPPLGSAMQQCA